jgi:hypothetical protein
MDHGATGDDGHLMSGAVEQTLIAAARVTHEQCACGGQCTDRDEEAIPAAVVGRLRSYLAAHPTHQFFYDETGTVAVVLGWDQDEPVVREATDLESLLDALGVGPISGMS